jgi:hypothetical protein
MAKIAYICSPFSGDVVQNTINARRFCKFAVSEGFLPLAPHLLFPQFLDDDCPEERELGLAFALDLLGKANELWVFGISWSEGMRREIAVATECGIAIRYLNEEAVANGVNG